MPDQICHIDVGLSRQVAHIVGQKPTILILCGAPDSTTIHDSAIAIRSNGGYPAACTCSACQAIASIMYYEDLPAHIARRRYEARRSHA